MKYFTFCLIALLSACQRDHSDIITLPIPPGYRQKLGFDSVEVIHLEWHCKEIADTTFVNFCYPNKSPEDIAWDTVRRIDLTASEGYEISWSGRTNDFYPSLNDQAGTWPWDTLTTIDMRLYVRKKANQ